MDQLLNKIFNEDCLTTMDRIPDNFVDLVNTDPPYNVGKYYLESFTNDNLPENEYWEWYKNIFTEIFRILKDRTYLYVSSTSPQMFEIKNILEDIGFKYIQPLIWYRPNTAGGGNSRFAWPWMKMFEPINMFSKGKRRRMINAPEFNTHDVFNYAMPQTNQRTSRFHVAQKPIKLYRHLISRTPGQIIYDPFGGSGTTALAAIAYNRDYIISEINPEDCKIAQKRIDAELNQQKLAI